MSESILVVDGAATNRILLKVRLASAFYDVHTARTLDEALDLMARRPFAVIIVGGDTPDASRVTICARLVIESAGHMPVIVVANAAERLAALRAGATAVVARPVEESVLLARIRSAIRDAHPMAMWGMGGSVDLAHFVPPAQSGENRAELPLRTEGAPSATPITGEIVLIGQSTQVALFWRQMLQGRLGHKLRVLEPERALAESAASHVPELYLISAGIMRDGDGLQLMSELRSRPNSRDAAFAVVVPPDRPDLMAITLDLGAGDVIEQDGMRPANGDETALRLAALIARKRGADRRRQAEADSRQWALADELTGIPNRRFALARLAEMAAQRPCDHLASIVVDVDHFKRVNDRHGHLAGDAVLIAVAQRLQSHLPKGAFLARMGGEEFLAILPGYDAEQAHHLAERLCASMAATPFRLPESAGGWLIPVTLSAGVAQTRCDALGHDTHGLLDRADRAMMGAKASGRNRVYPLAVEYAA